MKNKLTALWERILFYVSVPTCVCCKTRLDVDDAALCKKCVAKREGLKFRNCSYCGERLHRCSCSSEYLENHYVKKLVKCFRYMQRPDTLPLNSPIYSLKRHNRNDVLNFCAKELSEAILHSFPNANEYVFTNVPRSKRSIIKYGMDHGELLARKTAELIGAKYEKILISNVKAEQKKLYGEERRLNAQFEVVNDLNLSGKTVIIIDDIVTTGASMGSAAMLIHGQGAKRIYGAALGIAYKDKYVPFTTLD